MHIPTTEQIERLNQIRFSIEGYKSKIIEAKEARKSIKDLTAYAKTILRGGPPKPRKPRTVVIKDADGKPAATITKAGKGGK